MIDGSDSEDEDASANAKRAGADVAGSAYRESITSVDGFTRGPNGRVKFNKDTKKRRRENDEAEEDVEMADGDAGKGKKSKRKSDVKLGHEFKAKVIHNIGYLQRLLTSRTESRRGRQKGECGSIRIYVFVSSGKERRGSRWSGQNWYCGQAMKY